VPKYTLKEKKGILVFNVTRIKPILNVSVNIRVKMKRERTLDARVTEIVYPPCTPVVSSFLPILSPLVPLADIISTLPNCPTNTGCQDRYAPLFLFLSIARLPLEHYNLYTRQVDLFGAHGN